MRKNVPKCIHQQTCFLLYKCRFAAVKITSPCNNKNFNRMLYFTHSVHGMPHNETVAMQDSQE